MIRITVKGDSNKTNRSLRKLSTINYERILGKYAEQGLDALQSATPKDTGKTADSWYYTISAQNNVYKIEYSNSNIQNGINVAVILQHGHATRNGGWVEGIDYINPALTPIFKKIAVDAWEEVKKA